MPKPLSPRPLRSRIAGGLVPAGAATLAIASASPACAQVSTGGIGFGNILPNVGVDPRVGDFRPQLESFLNPGVSTAVRPAFLIQPAIEGDVGVTDNALRVNSPRRADIFTIISPSIAVSGDTRRLQVNISYNPQAVIYANTSSQDQVYQYFNGQALLTVVPDAFFIDFRGAITQSSLTGGFNQQQNQSLNNQNTVQTTTFEVSPYLQHRFGGFGSGEIRYTIARTLQNDQGNQVNNPLTQENFGQAGFGSIGNLTTQTESASFTSGENLGRFNDSLTGSATQFYGSGSYVGAYRNEIQNEVGFAVNHSFTVLAGLGYQDLSYSGTPGYRLNAGTYNIGFRWAPSPDTNFTILYGRHDGSSQVEFDGELAPTARTRFVTSYTTGITTDLQQAQSFLNNTTVGTGGLVTATNTGAPVLNSGFNGVQDGVYRLNRFSASLSFLQTRDSYSLFVSNEVRTSLTSTPTLLGNGIVPAGTNTNSTFGGISWQHDLSPNTNLTASGQYGFSTNTGQYVGTGSQNTQTLQVTAALSRQFTETLSGSLRYTFTNQSGNNFTNQSGNQFTTFNGFNTGSYSENSLLLGLRKSF